MTDKKKTNLFGKLFGRFKKDKADHEGHDDFDENEDLIDEAELDDDKTAPGIRFEDIEEDEDEVFVAQEFNISDEKRKELEQEDATGEHDVQSMLSESEDIEDELPPAPADEDDYPLDEEVDLPPAPEDEFEEDFDAPPEDFPVEETPPLYVDEEGEEIPSIPGAEEEFPEIPAAQMEEMSVPKKGNVTDNRPIDLDAIKNYEFTDEDDQDAEETLSAYKMFDPTKHAKGIRAFLEKSKEKLGNIKLDGLKEKFKHLSSPEGLKSLKTPKFLKNFKWDKAIETLYHPDSRRMIHRGFIASSVIAGTWSAGKIIALSIKGPPDTSVSKTAPILMGNNANKFNFQDVNSIRSANLFNAKMSKDEPKLADQKPKVIDSPEVCTKASKKSTLPYKLVNTTVLQDSVKSIASVQVRSSNDLENFRVGDKIATKAEIGFIDRMKVIFKNLSTGECEYIANEEAKTRDAKQQFNIVSPEVGKKLMNQTKNDDIKNEGNNYRIKKAVRDSMLGNISEVLTQARAIQIKNPDGSFSFKMTEIVPGSVYSQLGIQDGDIITQINGKRITNLNEVMALFGKIKDIDQFQLNIKRGGIESVKEYEFE